MTYFECVQCGQLADLSVFDHTRLRQDCPVCEQETDWETAFEGDGGESF